MSDIELLTPASLDEALTALAEGGDEVKIISGGTALVLMMKNRLLRPEKLVSIGGIRPDLSFIDRSADGLRVGGLATLREVETSAAARAFSLPLAQTFGVVANVRIRNAATVAGNICEADYASDPPSLLIAMGARVTAQSRRASRELELSNFYTGFYETVIEPDEIVTELFVPAPPAYSGAAYVKFKTRSSEDRPCVGVAAAVVLRPDLTCHYVRVVVSAVADVPQQLPDIERLAVGQTLTDMLIAEIAEGYSATIEPLSDIRGSAWYRKQIIRVITERALRSALTRAYGVESA